MVGEAAGSRLRFAVVGMTLSSCPGAGHPVVEADRVPSAIADNCGSVGVGYRAG
jgi:hypothetical protein